MVSPHPVHRGSFLARNRTTRGRPQYVRHAQWPHGSRYRRIFSHARAASNRWRYAQRLAAALNKISQKHRIQPDKETAMPAIGPALWSKNGSRRTDMMSPRKWWIVVGLFSVVATVLAVLWFWHRCPDDPGVIVRIECSHDRGYSLPNDHPWDLDLDGDGVGTLTIHPGVTEQPEQRRHVSVSMAAFQKAIRENHLCELPSQIGAPTPDASTDRMRIRTTNLDKTITLDFVDPRKLSEDDRRAFRLWDVIQGWASDAKAANQPNRPK
jgi:hypothetical protein